MSTTVPTPRRHLLAWRRSVSAITVLGLVVGLLGWSTPAAAAPEVSATAEVHLEARIAPSTLLGHDIEVVLDASDTDGTDGYNLSFTTTVPTDVTYVAGSTRIDGRLAPDPTAAAQPDGSTLLTWRNVSDLLADTSAELAFDVRPDTTVYAIGDEIGLDAAAFDSEDPRMLPGLDVPDGVATTATRLSPFELTKREASAESELLRGLDAHPTVFTVQVLNNSVDRTTEFSIVDHIPAGLEFLGCGTDTGVTVAPCLEPSSVSTVTADPDGDGPLANGQYTRVEWDSATLAAGLGSADLAPSASFSFDYVAAIALFDDAGALTADEQLLVGHARAFGNYAGTLPSSDDDSEEVIAEDVSIHLHASTGSFSHGSTTTWTLLVESSEYALRTGPIVITQVIPDGLEFVRSTTPLDAEYPVSNADGSLTVRWTLPGFTAPSSVAQISFDTTTRWKYRATKTPVAATDGWTSTVELSTVSDVVTAADGTTTTLPIGDTSLARQRSAGPRITKDVAAPLPGTTCGDGSALTFAPDAVGPLGAGDRVCWRLTVELPTDLDLLSLVVEDHLPAGFAFESQNASADIFSSSGQLLSWNVGDLDATTGRFQVVVQTRVDDPAIADPSDLVGNLMKVRHSNTDGDSFQLRDDASILWGEPVLDLVTGVADINDIAVAGAPADGVRVEAGDIVTNRVVVTNSGNVDAVKVSVRHGLAANTTCSTIRSISNGGSCTDAGSWIQWDGLDVRAGDTIDVTYDLQVPIGIAAATTMASVAGVRSYDSVTNSGTGFRYVPANNVDPTVLPNAVAADDPWSVQTARPTVQAARTTSVNEAGNNKSTQATIGETVTYTYDVTLPKGTTIYGPSSMTDGLGNRLDLVEASVSATLDGGPLPTEWVISTTGNTVKVSLATPYAVSPTADETVRLTFDAVIVDAGINLRPGRFGNALQFRWADDRGASAQVAASITVQIVEPVLTLGKTHDDADSIIESGQSYRYTVTAGVSTTTQTSTAHDVKIVDTVSSQLTVLDSLGQPVQNGAVVGPDGGVWNATARTITWSVASIAPGASSTLRYDVRAASPIVANSAIAGTVEATASSMQGVVSGERTTYQARATDSAKARNLTISTDVITPSATIGEPVDVTVTVTVPADTIGYDVTVIDDLPVGLTYESLTAVRCEQPAATCTATASGLTNGRDVAFFLGDLTEPAPTARVVTIEYLAIVTDVPAASAGAVLAHAAAVHLNTRDTIAGVPASMPTSASFDSASTTATDRTTVVEPTLRVDKATSTARSAPGSTLAYSVTVTNPAGAAVSAAYDIVVTDAPDPRLLRFADTTTASGVSVVDGDQSDGSLAWKIAGPLLPGASVTITYELTVPTTLDWNDELVAAREVLNTADVSAYYGVADAIRSAHPTRSYRAYDDVSSDTVGVELDLASISGRIWNDVDLDHLRDADEPGIRSVGVIVTYHGTDGRLGGVDDEVHHVVTVSDGSWMARGLPGGTYSVEIDANTLPAGMQATYDSTRGAIDPTGSWTGTLREDDHVSGIDAGFGTPDDTVTDPSLGNDGAVWVTALKPSGTAYVRTRTADDVWSRWYQQGPANTWASMSVNTDRAGNVWVVGVKLTGEAYVRTKSADPRVNVGWSGWYRQGTGGWSSMSLATDPAGNVWVVGVKANGVGYARVKNAGSAVTQSWSGWVKLGTVSWSSIAIATDTTGRLWLAGVTRSRAAYVLQRSVGGDMTANWSSWLRQGTGTDWETLDLATDANDTLWLSGVKQSGTAYLREKTSDRSLSRGWSSWLQLGQPDSWASMTLTVDAADSLWIAGVKHSGTGYVRMKCICVGIANGWSGWMQQGSVNSWDTLEVVADPVNRVILAGMKLGGTAYTRTKANVAGLSTGWSGWTQHAAARSWGSFSAQSDAWVGLHRPRTPSLETRDDVWVAPLGWLPSTNADGDGLIYSC